MRRAYLSVEARYNKANYSLDGPDGSALDLNDRRNYGDITDTEESRAVSEDVIFDPLIYDYVLPASKEVDALTISSAPGRGG